MEDEGFFRRSSGQEDRGSWVPGRSSGLDPEVPTRGPHVPLRSASKVLPGLSTTKRRGLPCRHTRLSPISTPDLVEEGRGLLYGIRCLNLGENTRVYETFYTSFGIWDCASQFLAGTEKCGVVVPETGKRNGKLGFRPEPGRPG